MARVVVDLLKTGATRHARARLRLAWAWHPFVLGIVSGWCIKMHPTLFREFHHALLCDRRDKRFWDSLYGGSSRAASCVVFSLSRDKSMRIALTAVSITPCPGAPRRASARRSSASVQEAART